jgi:C4-dicarboxylate-specific signal transduction histidine kinase
MKQISDSLKLISNDKNDFKKVSVNLNDVINESALLYTEQLKNKQIRFEVVSSENPITMDMATVEFSQVMINLLSNAKHAVEELVEADQRFISIKVQKNKDLVWVEVENGGPQIPVEVQEKIFDSFFTTKPVGVGTGLGLSISVRIVSKLGGTLYLDKEADRPKFVIKLPLVSP